MNDKTTDLKKELEYGKEALNLVRELSSRTMHTLDEIDQMIAMIRRQVTVAEDDGRT